MFRHFISPLFSALVFLVVIFSGCNFQQREAELQKRSDELTQKEQQLILREKALQLKEDSIKLLLARGDSTSFADSIAILPAKLTGEWSAKMVCTQTSCPGSAIGDVQTDNWQFSTQDSSLIIKSVSRGQINRVYTGNYYRGNTIRVTVSSDNPQSGSSSRLIEITEIRDTKMKGTRTVTQPDGCQIVYSLELDKKQKP